MTDREKSELPLPMTGQNPVGGQPVTRKKYTPAFTAECVCHITYLPLTGGRWGYLATYQRQVVGCSLAAQLPTELVVTALEQALTLGQPAPNLVIHADWGSQYTSSACCQRIEEAEAGWSILKTELATANYRPGSSF